MNPSCQNKFTKIISPTSRGLIDSMIPENDTKTPRLSQRFVQALTYTFHLHQHQFRKGSSVPYFSHLMSVSALVLEDGGDEDAAIAALLHDAIEDQGGNAIRNEIQQRFGDRVLQMVEACTESDETPKPSWKQRKLRAIAQLHHAEPATQRVIIADKLHNLRCIWADWQRCGDRVWARFNASPSDILWFYRACVEAVGDRFSSPMLAELRALLAECLAKLEPPISPSTPP
jgi:(p)ppGpp synthase/HD superfamily hydrolase